jgi:hypothetical protein
MKAYRTRAFFYLRLDSSLLVLGYYIVGFFYTSCLREEEAIFNECQPAS